MKRFRAAPVLRQFRLPSSLASGAQGSHALPCPWLSRLLALGCSILAIPAISNAQLTIAIPNGGEKWDGGQRQCVYWGGQGTQVSIELSTDGGATWTVVAPWLQSYDRSCLIECPDVTSANCLVRISDLNSPSNSDISDSAFSMFSSSLGPAWTLRESGTSAELKGIVFADLLRGWVCGDSGTILRTTDGGMTWGPQNSGTTNVLSSIAISPGGVGVSVGTAGTMVRSTDGGATWQPTPPSTEAGLADVAFNSATSAIAIGYGTILRSVDAGLTWESVPGAPDNYLSRIAFRDSMHGAIVGGSGPYGNGGVLLLTTDGGGTWTPNLAEPGELYGLGAVAYPDDSLLVTAGDWYDSFSTNSFVLVSHDLGQSWLTTLEFRNVGTGGVLFVFHALHFVDSRQGFMVGNDPLKNSGVFLQSTDGGASWDLRSAYYFPSWLNDVWFTGPTQGTIIGRGGTIYQTSTGGLVSVEPAAFESVPKGFLLLENYPNPFNPSTTIRYGLPSRSHVTLTIFNTLGQQVATLVEGEQEAGFHEAVFDASGLASGVYLYRLTAGSYVETRKLALVR